MKNIFLIILLITTTSLFAQKFQFGIKGGVNYNFSGELTREGFGEVEEQTYDVLHGAESKIGYHAGAFVKLKSTSMFLQSELLYSEFENTYETAELSVLQTKKIDIPIMVGLNIVGPIYLSAGPSFQYILTEDFTLDKEHVKDIKYDDFSVGLHVGLQATYNNFTMELRWDRGLQESELEMTGIDTSGYTYTLDNRQNQLLFTLQYALFNK